MPGSVTWVGVCLWVYKNERVHLLAHVSVTIQLFTGTCWTITRHMELVCVHLKSFVLTKCVCISLCSQICGAALLGRNAWGNRSLRHTCNATQVFLESTSHNCTWQTGAPATPTLSHWSGNSLNLYRELPEQFFFFFHLRYSIHMTAYKNEYVR